jgi:RHS repeat-associated protein
LSETWYADTADADAGQNALDVFQYAYNSAGQIVSESSVGQVANLSSTTSSSDVYTYDSQGRETSVTESSTGGPTVVLSYQYTGTSTEPSVVSASIDGTPDYQDTYQYDSQGDVTQITQTGQSGGDAVATVQVDLTYNAAGQPQTISRYVGGQLAVTATYSYDSDDNLTGLVYSQGGTTLSQYAWTYSDESALVVPASAGSTGSAELNWTPGSNIIVPPDNPSQIAMDLLSGSTSPTNLIASATSVDGTANYSYDPAGQLTGATYGGSQPDESYSYDSNGNRTNTGYVIGPDNELLSDGTYNYSYDADGNRVERTNIATGAVTDYVWDNRDRLVEVIDRASAGGAITQDVHYYYDAENRWIGETVSIPGQAVQETSYAYCGNQIVLEFDGTASTSPLGVANLSHRYLWGPAVDQILADEQVTDPTQSGNVLLPLTNNVGTVCDLAQFNAETGATSVVDHRVYDSFGNLVSQTNAAVDFLFGFDGAPTGGATGLTNELNRWYDSETGRWMSQDPIGFTAGDANQFRFVSNSPVNAVDPSGLLTVYVWPPHGTHTGHTSIQLDDNTYISWWPQGDPPIGSPEWFARLSGVPGRAQKTLEKDNGEEGAQPRAIIITGLNEAAIKQWWETFKKNPSAQYEILFQQCCTIVAQALQVGGSGTYTIWLPNCLGSPIVWTPPGVWIYAQAVRLTQIILAQISNYL